MAFKAVKSLIGGAVEVAPPGNLETFQMTDGEAAYKGRVYEIVKTTGKLTLTDDNSTGFAAVIVMEDADAATPGAYVRASWIMPGVVYKCPITDKDGTALTTLDDAVFMGATVTINDTGTGIDGETDNVAVNGPLTVLKIDETNELAWVVFNTCLICLDVVT
jgi:hypothetical protein